MNASRCAHVSILTRLWIVLRLAATDGEIAAIEHADGRRALRVRRVLAP
ncbi:hypothetical protein PV773_14100 [Mesorhizobium sp. CC13]